MFRTAFSLDTLDILDELHAYDSVGHAVENHNIWQDEYKDADLYIMLMNDSELDEIKILLSNAGYYSAYIEIDEGEVIKVN